MLTSNTHPSAHANRMMLFAPLFQSPPPTPFISLLLLFFSYFSLSLQTDIHASLHMGFNLPLSPKIFLAQAWDKGIITSKGSWGGKTAPSLPAERTSGQYANWEGELITGSVQRDAWPRPLFPPTHLILSVFMVMPQPKLSLKPTTAFELPNIGLFAISHPPFCFSVLF